MKLSKWEKVSAVLHTIALFAIFFTLICQTVGILLFWDPDANYFLRGAIAPTVSYSLVLLSAVFETLSVVLCRAECISCDIFPKTPKISLLSVGYLLSMTGFFLAPVYGSFFAEHPAVKPVIGGLLLCSVLYHALTALPEIRRKSGLMALLGFFPAFALAMLVIYCYFDRTLEMNSPIKIYLLLSLSLAMVLQVGEVRIYLGKPQKKIFRILSGLFVSVSALASPAIPIAYLCGKMDRLDYVSISVLLLFLQVTAGLRILKSPKVSSSGAEKT